MTTLGAASYYDNSTDQHLEERSNSCEFTNLDNQSGVRSTLALNTIIGLDGFETVLQNTGNSYIPMWDSYYMKFNYLSASNSTSNKGNHMKNSLCLLS